MGRSRRNPTLTRTILLSLFHVFLLFAGISGDEVAAARFLTSSGIGLGRLAGGELTANLAAAVSDDLAFAGRDMG